MDLPKRELMGTLEARNMPAKGKSKVPHKQRAAHAAGRIVGKTSRNIAADWIKREHEEARERIPAP